MPSIGAAVPYAFDHEAWTAANNDAVALIYLRLALTPRAGKHQIVLVTRAWLTAYRELPMTDSERGSVGAVVRSLASGKHPHPALGATRLRLEPLGAMIGTPAPDIYLTWRRLAAMGQPVMLTLTRG